MTNVDELNDVISKSGLSKTFIAKKLGITRQALYRKLRNELYFRQNEITALRKLLNLSEAETICIFFADEVGKMDTAKGG